MKRPIWLLLGLLAAGVLSGTAQAADYDGYLFQLRSDTAWLAAESGLPAGAEKICGKENLYRTEDPELVRELAAADRLVYAEPDYVVTLADLPDDPYYLDGTQWNASMLGMEAVWELGVTGAGVRVGVIDSGIYGEHEEFSGAAMIPGTNYCVDADSPERYDTSDGVGHGTFVAGVLAAAAGNGAGIAGFAPDVELVPLKCFTANTGLLSSIIAGIYGAVDDYDCQILNMSWGMEVDSQALRDAVEYAAAADVVMAAAVGNLPNGTVSTGDDPLLYPAAYDVVIGVGAVDADKNAASFSYQNESVFVTAPGEDLIGLGTGASAAYRTGSGTSYAAPAVAAAAALARSLWPEITQRELESILRETAEDLGSPGYDPIYGYGLLRMGTFVDRVREQRAALNCRIADDGSLRLSAGLWDRPPGESLTAVGAIYRADGRLWDIAVERVFADQAGFSGCDLRIPAGAAAGLEIKVFFLDADHRPVCGPRCGAWP